MTGMFLTISRCNVKAGNEMEARKLVEKELNPNDGSKPSDHVDGLVGFGLMKSKRDPSMYGICTVWRSEDDLNNFSKDPRAKDPGGLVEKLQKLCDGDIKGEGFYIESL